MIDAKRKEVNDAGLICIPSGNHDMDRLARALPTLEEQKLVFAFLLTMPGAPFIYYGDEIGMRYVEGLVSKEGGYNRTGSRSPMQWDNSKQNAGFSSAPKEDLYVPQDSKGDRPDAQSALQNNNSLLNEIKRLIELRQKTPQLKNNSLVEFIKTGPELIYKRFEKGKEAEALTITITPKNSAIKIENNAGLIIYELSNL